MLDFEVDGMLRVCVGGDSDSGDCDDRPGLDGPAREDPEVRLRLGSGAILVSSSSSNWS